MLNLAVDVFRRGLSSAYVVRFYARQFVQRVPKTAQPRSKKARRLSR